MRNAARLLRVVGVLPHGRGQLLHARGGFFERCGLLFGALRQIGVALGNFTGGKQDRLARLADARDDTGKPFAHIAQCEQQAVGIAGASVDLHAKVASRDTVGNLRGVAGFAAELPPESTRDQPREQHAGHQRAKHKRRQHDAHLPVAGCGLGLRLARLLTTVVDQQHDPVAQGLARGNRAPHQFLVVDAR
jgi:hypothetical protein